MTMIRGQRRTPWPWILALLLSACGAPTAEPPPGALRAHVAEYDRPDTPGVVLAVFRGGRVVAAETAGMASLEWDIPVTPETAFNIASVSKQFTAFAIALLESRGELSIDDDVRTYLPELPDFGRTITIRHMLNHTSGMRSLHAVVELAGWRDDDRRTNEDIWRIMLRQRDLNFEPGAEYLYCNTGYMLSALIVERVTGESFADWMKANVFDPIGMTRTSVQDDYDRIYRNTAASYRKTEDGWAPATPYWAYYGSGNIHTTVADIAKWAHNFTTADVGGPAVIDRMQERGVLANGDTLRYALGINVIDVGSLTALTHGGSIGGYRSNLLVFPEIDAGVVVFGNGSSLPEGGLIGIAEEMFGEVGEARVGEAREAEHTAAPTSDAVADTTTWHPDDADLVAFVGRYVSDELDTAYEIGIEHGRLVAWHMRHGIIPLEPEAPGRFDSRLARIRFDSRDGAPGLYMTNGRARNVWFRRD